MSLRDNYSRYRQRQSHIDDTESRPYFHTNYPLNGGTDNTLFDSAPISDFDSISRNHENHRYSGISSNNIDRSDAFNQLSSTSKYTPPTSTYQSSVPGHQYSASNRNYELSPPPTKRYQADYIEKPSKLFKSDGNPYKTLHGETNDSFSIAKWIVPSLRHLFKPNQKKKVTFDLKENLQGNEDPLMDDRVDRAIQEKRLLQDRLDRKQKDYLESQVESLKRELNNLQHENDEQVNKLRQHYRREISQLQDRLQKLYDENVTLNNRQIAERDDRLITERIDMKRKREEIEELEAVVLKKQKKYVEEEHHLRSLLLQLESKERTLKHREDAFESNRINQEKDLEIRRREIEVTYQSQLDALDEEKKDIENRNNVLQKLFDRKQREVEEQKYGLVGRETKISKTELELTNRKKELELREQALNTRESEISRKEQDLAKRESELLSQIRKRDEELHLKEREISLELKLYDIKRNFDQEIDDLEVQAQNLKRDIGIYEQEYIGIGGTQFRLNLIQSKRNTFEPMRGLIADGFKELKENNFEKFDEYRQLFDDLKLYRSKKLKEKDGYYSKVAALGGTDVRKSRSLYLQILDTSYSIVEIYEHLTNFCRMFEKYDRFIAQNSRT